jgi:2,3,4,5-tetrahydropyridine-2-carboxylate N-succinyltransferase
MQNIIENSTNEDELKAAASQTMRLLDQGEIRVAEKKDGLWQVNLWVKKAILLYFQFQKCVAGDNFYDKIPLKFQDWDNEQFSTAALRVVPGSTVRFGSFLEKNVVVMPSFINIGAYVGEGTMIDTWATVGSCAQIGKRCHISGGTGIGGVLEPLQATPVIIEDNCFIGARSEIAEGVIVEEGCVVSMGVYVNASTKIIHRETGTIYQGRIPAYSVVVPGNHNNLYCAVIVKTVDEKTRSKTAINELLRL